jgi:hypothetical protein
MSILARIINPFKDRLQYWQEIVAQLEFDSKTQYISPEETKQAPLVTLKARLHTLLRVYQNDYHTDAFDFERLAKGISNGRERISFWGDEHSINSLKDWMQRQYQPTDFELDELNLGTATLLDVQHEYGDGYAEMCRTANACSAVPATGPILCDLMCLLNDPPEHFARYHTLLSFPRNRTSTIDIRGGAAIHRLHVREIESSFWGIAPWYVMQGGYLEVLDYRELYRYPCDTVRGFGEVLDLYCSSEAEAIYLSGLMTLNLGDERLVPKVHVEGARAEARISWCVQSCSSIPLIPYNPVRILPDSTGPFDTLQDAVVYGESQGGACLVVYLPLDRLELVAYQNWLRQRGYRLTGMVPPKYISVTDTFEACTQTHTPCYGVWARPRPGMQLATPYYFKYAAHTPIENSIIRYLSDICTSWVQK